MCACIQDYKMVSYTMDSSATNSFFDRGKFEAVKMLSGGRAPRCSKH